MSPAPDRLPPHSVESEQGVLACILLSPNDRLPEVIGRLQNNPKVFYDLRVQEIFKVMVEMFEKGKAIDVVTLHQRLKDKQLLEQAGGIAYLSTLPDAVPSAANLNYYLEIVQEKYLLRKMIYTCTDIVGRVYDYEGEVDALMDGVERDILRVTEERVRHNRAAVDWDQLLQPVDYSDNLLGDRFLERGQGCLLYGPAGCGKSVAALQAAAEWSCGLDGLHIKPTKPLRLVILQTEDSLNDCRDSLHGIFSSTLFTADKLDLVKKNLLIMPPVAGGTGEALSGLLKSAAIQHKPDLILLNPLLAFCPGDPARELGGLLYQVVDPVLKRHRVGFLGVHHTPKTNSRDTSGYNAHDWQYLAAGDARVANWPRAMIGIEPVAAGVYRFRISKRSQRAGWTWDCKPTGERYFRHHPPPEIRWVDSNPEEANEARTVADYRQILKVLPGPAEVGISRQRVRNEAKVQLQIGEKRADDWLKLAIEDGAAEAVAFVTDNKRKAALFKRKGA